MRFIHLLLLAPVCFVAGENKGKARTDRAPTAPIQELSRKAQIKNWFYSKGLKTNQVEEIMKEWPDQDKPIVKNTMNQQAVPTN